MSEAVFQPVCSVKYCDIWAESIKRFGLELCYQHQLLIDKWLVEKGYSREVK